MDIQPEQNEKKKKTFQSRFHWVMFVTMNEYIMVGHYYLEDTCLGLFGRHFQGD